MPIKDTKFANTLFDLADTQLSIDSSFIWEGSVHWKVASIAENSITYNIYGSSEVEHDGDVSGIYAGVSALKDKTANVQIGEETYQVKIVSTKCNVTENDREVDDDGNIDYDSDYTVTTRGELTLSYSLLTTP